MRFILALARLLLGTLFRLRVHGLEKLRFDQRTLLLPNHVSLLDAALLALYLPEEVTFVVNTDIARRFKLLVGLRKHVTVDPLNPYSVRQMVRTMNSGVPLVLFPEGRITVTGGLMKVYQGAGYIALKTGAALYPIIIDGAERSKLSYIQDKVKSRWFPQIHIHIGDSFKLRRDETMPMRRQKEEASDRILRMLQEHLAASRLKTGVQLFDEVLAASRKHGSSTVICRDIHGNITYRKLLLTVYALAGRLKARLQGETSVALLLPSSIAHVAALLALARLGKTPAILNFSAGSQNICDACETAGVQTVLTSRQFVEKGRLQPLMEALDLRVRIVYLEDVKTEVGLGDQLGALASYLLGVRSADGPREIILFTSGSESKPKGVVLSHDNIYANIQQSLCLIDLTPKDRMLNALPMFHSFGLTAGTLLPLLSGCKTFLYPSPLHYRMIPELSYEDRTTILFGTSTFLSGYGRTAHPYDFFSLRYVFAGAEKLKPEVRDMWFDKFGIRIMEGYGITETAPILALNTPLAYRKGSVGRLLPGMAAMLEPVEGITGGGNLLVKGPNVMKGYLIHGQGFVPAGDWYSTGDVVEIDKQGFLTILARLKRFAKIGGEMVSLNLVEELAQKAAETAPASQSLELTAGAAAHVQSSGGSTAVRAKRRSDSGGFAAVNTADGRKGERIVLFSTDSSFTREQLAGYLNSSGHSLLLLPARILYVDQLPLLGSGKTDYVTLRAWAEQS
ncbi:AMP-binding protein [Paenibacillus sp. y28]|uniref:AMP-binding protein n=1 Tax=Paenibacillus sp. y28 TaxID=3129110 RepID=UPI003019C126